MNRDLGEHLGSDIVESSSRPRSKRLAAASASVVMVAIVLWLAVRHGDVAPWILVGGALAGLPAVYGRWRVRRAEQQER